MNESTESARVPGTTPLLAGSLPESLPAKALPGECKAILASIVVPASKQASQRYHVSSCKQLRATMYSTFAAMVIVQGDGTSS